MEPVDWRNALRQLRRPGSKARCPSVPGVQDARVNLATERATVVVQPDRVNIDRLVESVGKAGYTARRNELSFGAETAAAIRRERDEQVALWGKSTQGRYRGGHSARAARAGLDVRPRSRRRGLGRLVDVRPGEPFSRSTSAARTSAGPGSDCSRDRQTWIP